VDGAERASNGYASKSEDWARDIVVHIRQALHSGFTGLGLIAYRPPLRIATMALAPNRYWPPLPRADLASTARFLCGLSDVGNPLHDGFHLIDADSLHVTHVSHLVVPAVPAYRPAELPDRPVGARLMTALLMSRQPAVRFALTMTATGAATLFDNGRMFPLSP
jgi:hypothetical protein